jgi:radical SAM protein with 4Fe4S-binding SPASM domain
VAPAPIIISWNLTRRCNLACAHCYLDAVQRRREPSDELDTAEACRLMEQIAALAPGAMLVLSGGEPLLRRDLVALVKRAAGGGLVPVVGTNATLLGACPATALKAAGAAGIGASVDSATPEFHDRLRGRRGAWRAAMDGILAARRAGLPVALQATVFEENRGELGALADLAESLGAIALSLFFLVCTGRGVKRTDLAPTAYEEALAGIVKLQQERPRLLIRARCAPHLRRLAGLHACEARGAYAEWSSACLAGRSYFRITPQGQVTPCPYLPEVVGDAKATPLREIWERHPLLLRLRTELPGGKCGDCDFRYGCGGCRARAFAERGDVMAEDPSCAYVRSADALPERPRALAPPRRVTWEPAAQALLERIPAVVRARVAARLEECAANEGRSRISVAFMRAHRPPLPSLAACPMGRPAGDERGTR